ncbi:MAG: sulfurtransferase-like selenium metabolism protein YedF [Treponema sp.]|nr:sulfurtransferase-like selenium metabolism protein YedF [Treponema sp.]
MKTVDMQGQPCPIPVVKAKEALAEQGAKGVIVLVDNVTAALNLEKMAKGTGCGFSYTEEGSLFRVSILKGADSDQFFNERQEGSPEKPEPAGRERKGPVALITADSMGRGAEDLGRLLIKGFIFSLSQLDPLPEALVFLNGGAHLTTEGANTVPDLKALEEKGTGIYTCGTCANYYKLTESLAVGSIVDMMNIVNRLAKASSVITI